MGRPRKTNRHLPANMQFKGRWFYYVSKNRWIKLATDYATALIEYANIIGRSEVPLKTYADWCRATLEAKKHGKGAKKVSPATLKGYAQAAKNTCEVFGSLTLFEIGSGDVHKYVVMKGNVAANRDKAWMSSVYSYARRLGEFAADDPTKGHQFRNDENARERYVTDGEYARILEVASPKMSAAIRLIYLLGCRVSDALAIEVKNIDDETLTYWNSKSKEWVRVALSDDLREAVNDAMRLWRRFGRVWLFESRAESGKQKSKPVTAYSYSGFRSNWLRVLKKAGLEEHVILHDFRAKAASDQDTDERAAELLTHKDSKVTKRHYRRKKKVIQPTK